MAKLMNAANERLNQHEQAEKIVYNCTIRGRNKWFILEDESECNELCKSACKRATWSQFISRELRRFF
jgi:hypothetical protein